ncbi:MAG: hypothetical protein IKQ39_03975 [Oscillospiraceae bacterium]|nr:hypothetical protein [Oscillospiraceae bacterium]
MKKPHIYLISVFLSILLIFSFLVTGLIALMHFKGMEADTCLQIVQDKQLAQAVHESLTQYFTDQENTTGIPVSVYENSITAEACETIIRDSVKNGFSYLNGRTAKVGTEPDFSVLEQDMRAFFEDYADQHKIEKNASYEIAVKESLTGAKAAILNACDVYRFRTLDDAGVMSKAQHVLKWSGFLTIGAGLVTLLLILFLFMTNHAEGRHGFYWTGISLLIASLLLLIPARWLIRTCWFDRFAIKTDHVFAAVTGFLYSLTEAATQMAIVGICAAVLLLLFLLMHIHVYKKETIRTAKH